MLTISLLLVSALLLSRKLADNQLRSLCVVSALLSGVIWSPIIVLPYLMIIWRMIRRAMDHPIKTRYPLFIARKRLIGVSQPGTVDRDWSLSYEWLVVVGIPPSETVRTCTDDGVNSNLEFYLVRKAELLNSGDVKQFKWSKSDLENQSYHLYHVGWSTHPPDMSAIVTDKAVSSGYSCLEFALYLAIQMSSLKVYTYFCSTFWLRWPLLICYALLILLAQYDGYGMQLAMINLIAAVEIYWLHLGSGIYTKIYTQHEEIQPTPKPTPKPIPKPIPEPIPKLPNPSVNPDLIYNPDISGRKIVDAVINKIRKYETFKNDFGYIRRIAWAETKYGLDHARPGYHGGLWKMDKEIFAKTKDTNSYPALTEKYDKIKSQCDIDWPSVQWEDLRKPLHGGLAIYLYMNMCVDESIPSSVQDQARHWKNNYNREEVNEEIFTGQVVDIEANGIGGTYVCS